MTVLQIYDKSLELKNIIDNKIVEVEQSPDSVEVSTTDEAILANYYDILLTTQTSLKDLIEEIEGSEEMVQTTDTTVAEEDEKTS